MQVFNCKVDYADTMDLKNEVDVSFEGFGGRKLHTPGITCNNLQRAMSFEKDEERKGKDIQMARIDYEQRFEKGVYTLKGFVRYFPTENGEAVCVVVVVFVIVIVVGVLLLFVARRTGPHKEDRTAPLPHPPDHLDQPCRAAHTRRGEGEAHQMRQKAEGDAQRRRRMRLRRRMPQWRRRQRRQRRWWWWQLL
jgi:hypothetical protein